MSILYLLPALGWGFMPIIAKLTNAKPINQLLGTTITALLIGTIFTIVNHPSYNGASFFIALLSGCFWSIGQYLQFYSFQLIPVSEAMPISNGTQLIGTTFIAAFLFKEWTSFHMVLIGLAGIILIVLGIFLTSYIEKQDESLNTGTMKKKAMICLLLSSTALVIYVTLPQTFEVSGAGIVFPQAFGMCLSAVILSLMKQDETDWKQVSRNFGTGVAWSIANISLFLVMPIIGVAKSFTFSQLAVLVSIYAGIFILKVQKKRKELWIISLGAMCITFGILMIGSIK